MTRIFLIDTNIAIYAIRRNPIVVEHMRLHLAQIVTSALVHSELMQGIGGRADVIEDIAAFARTIPVLPYDLDASSPYGLLVQRLGYSRKAATDRMIASHAISIGATLVTNNHPDFAEIPELKLEDWSASTL